MAREKLVLCYMLAGQGGAITGGIRTDYHLTKLA